MGLKKIIRLIIVSIIVGISGTIFVGILLGGNTLESVINLFLIFTFGSMVIGGFYMWLVSGDNKNEK